MTKIETPSLFSLLLQEPRKRAEELLEKGTKFVQYTSAESAFKIIKNRCLWLRNVRCMNDHSEVTYGLNLFVESLKDGIHENLIKAVAPSKRPLTNQIFAKLDEEYRALTHQTFIASISEHPIEEDLYGRLSMWRAYGGENPVALTFDPSFMLNDVDLLYAHCYPVNYDGLEGMREKLNYLVNVLENNQGLVEKESDDDFVSLIYEYFRVLVLTFKHPAFREEREWRIVYSPLNQFSNYMKSFHEVISGIPQEIHAIPLETLSSEGFTQDLDLNHLLKDIIIGPCEDAEIIRISFYHLLFKPGNELTQRLHITDIPLRR